MNWQDKGYLLSKNKYSENNSIAEFYTKEHGKVAGVIYGSTSKKIKNYLLIGNKFHLNFSSKNDSKIGYFKIEIDKIITPYFMEDKNKLLCITYSMNLIKLLTVEGQQNINVFELIKNLKVLLEDDKWLIKFIFWELSFYKSVGYDIEFKDYVDKETLNNGEEKYYVKSTNKFVPKFLINKNYNIDNTKDILDGFKIVGDYLEKTILKTIGINYPNSRLEFFNSIKNLDLSDLQNMKL